MFRKKNVDETEDASNENVFYAITFFFSEETIDQVRSNPSNP